MTAHPGAWDGRPVETRHYRVVVKGRLSERLASAFGDLELERRPGETVLSGPADQAQFRALLALLEDLGIAPVRIDVDD
jgi:hypothetical protein